MSVSRFTELLKSKISAEGLANIERNVCEQKFMAEQSRNKSLESLAKFELSKKKVVMMNIHVGRKPTMITMLVSG